MEPLLVEILREGREVYQTPTLEEMRRRRQNDEECLDSGVKRLINPHVYHVSLSSRVWELKQRLIQEAKNGEIKHSNVDSHAKSRKTACCERFKF
jgi:nicotinate phosphoribosyltransferase